MKYLLFGVVFFLPAGYTHAQHLNNPGSNHGNRFEQLSYLLPTPNEYRTASGAPGPRYWQQRADYDITCELDETNLKLTGSETITYYNNSPNPLHYLWLQLDENIHDPNSDNNRDNRSSMKPLMNHNQIMDLETWRKMEGYGVKITKLTSGGKSLSYTINQTMMRVDLPTDLMPGQKLVFEIDWNYKIPDRYYQMGRGGYEYFPEDGNYVFTMSQWYPRMAVYSDFQGWQTLPFTGGAEFALTFGNFKVKMTVPGDHIVGATGECRNYAQVLGSARYKRWQQAQSSMQQPFEVITLSEAVSNEKNTEAGKKTWIYEAQNVRDFAWTSSKKFIWDAMAVTLDGKKVMAMSYYPKEAYTLYSKYSTRVVAHTLKTYSKHTIPYPYPVAISVEASSGMEYPMICFNPGRTEKDGTYSEAVKYSMISVVIHEVGHNFFPMIVNSDERQWWWMDEGLNTFCQFLTEQEFDNNYPSRRGPAYLITDYMKLPKNELEPIMTMGDNVLSVGSNAYAKASTGLNILRETIMGRELFDYAFKQYARRWAFKHPTPADLFRTMEDASGIDLDWFWRGWWFGTEPVDISLDSVKWFKMDDPKNATALNKQEFVHIGQKRNKEDASITFATDADTVLRDYYYFHRKADEQRVLRQRDAMLEKDPENASKWVDKNFYELHFSNKGGMVMPVIIEWTYKDGTKEIDRVPVTVWRLNEEKFTKVFIKDKEATAIQIDPYRETADIDEENNRWPVKELPSRFQLFKEGQRVARGASVGGNAMQDAEKRQ
ncbi:MAG: M1 family metallopeptidase [Chitinophagaceae bacterium]|nr:M1 family metallopeptidase [Chitinophagaceae bacterium]